MRAEKNIKPCVRKKNYLFIRGPMGDVYVCICSVHCFYIRFVRSKTRRDARSILQCSAMLRMHVGIYMCTYTYAWVYMCVHATNTNLYMYVGAACGACVNKNTNKVQYIIMCFSWYSHGRSAEGASSGAYFFILCFSWYFHERTADAFHERSSDAFHERTADVFHIMLFMIFPWKVCRGAYYAADTKIGNLGHIFSYFSVPI